MVNYDDNGLCGIGWLADEVKRYENGMKSEMKMKLRTRGVG
jgi:hypothetical protein